MKKFLVVSVIVIVLTAAGFMAYRAYASGKTTSTTSTQTAKVTRASLSSTLSSSGTARANQNATISWQASGTVGAVMVKAGDKVEADQELAALDMNKLSTSMISAKQNLINAKKALDNLLNTKTEQAQTAQAVVDAQLAVDSLKQAAAEKASQAQLALANAKIALEDAKDTRTMMNYPHSTDPLVIQKAQTSYLVAKEQYKQAQKDFAKVERLKLTEPRRVRALENLLTARTKMNSALATYNWYLLPWTSDEIAQADGNLAVAQANLAAAQADWETLKNGASSAEIALAEARLADAQRAWGQVKDGHNADDVAAAETAVEVAQTALDQAHLLAPFAGTITEVNVKMGDVVSAGKSAYRIDDLSSIYIDLQVSEVDIQSVQIGQSATLTFDAIVEQEYNGEVTSIGMVGNSSQGVVNYSVTVRITDPDANIRSGMTASVSIIIAQAKDVLTVPNKAIHTSGGQKIVTVLYQGQQISLPVTVGLTNDSMSEVTSDQLKEGDVVVISGATTSTTTTTTNMRNNDFGGGTIIEGGGFGGPPPNGMP